VSGSLLLVSKGHSCPVNYIDIGLVRLQSRDEEHNGASSDDFRDRWWRACLKK
jgi:hypothetical protein